MEIAERSGLDNPTVARVSQELESQGMIVCHGGKGQYRVIYSLSAAGRVAAEKIRYEQSSRAVRRKLAVAAGDSLKEAAKSGFEKLVSWVAAGAIVSFAGWRKRAVIAHWLRHLIGNQ
jgi:DNA-binding IclR family transcriptional regulator